MVKYSLALLAALAASSSVLAFIAPSSKPILKLPMLMSSTSSTTSTTTRTPKRTLQDRSSEEAVSLLRDIIQAAYEAGPRAAPSRTIQAYVAITRTLQDFSPIS